VFYVVLPGEDPREMIDERDSLIVVSFERPTGRVELVSVRNSCPR
jgi:hypothetical protein